MKRSLLLSLLICALAGCNGDEDEAKKKEAEAIRAAEVKKATTPTNTLDNLKPMTKAELDAKAKKLEEAAGK